MNTANLQLEGLYVAVAALAEALREKGLLSAAELASTFERAETVAWQAAAEKDLSASNIGAIVFPIRYLKVAVEASANGKHLPFHEVARLVGEAKLPRPEGQYVRRGDELRAGGKGGKPKNRSHKLSDAEMLDLARHQEQEHDA
jgi:hypothetical protein